MKVKRLQLVLVAALLVAVLLPGMAQAARIKDIAKVDGVRDNQLLGFGLLGGLAGTGDDPKGAPYTAEAITNMLSLFGFQVDPAQLKVKNFAAVMVTADLPPYSSEGSRLDVTVSSIGSAKSLEGGYLYQTLLKGIDGNIYAIAQGQLSLGQLVGGGTSAGHPTVGRVPQGALIEREVPSTILSSDGAVRLNLNDPDFTTAAAVVAALETVLGMPYAFAENAGTIKVTVPPEFRTNTVPFIALLENVDVIPGRRAVVVINERTGTVVLGGDVEILPVMVNHGSMTFTFGTELQEPETEQIGEPGPLYGNTTAEQVAVGINKMELTPKDTIAVFQAIAAAGALLGELQII